MSLVAARYPMMIGARYAASMYRRRRAIRRAGRVARLAGVAYRNRGTLKSGYKRARMAIKTRQAKRARFSTRNVGEPVGTSTSKRFTSKDTTSVAKDSRTLYSEELTIIPHSSNNVIDNRQRNIVNLRGFKICMEFLNNIGQTQYFHVAIVSPKNSNSTVETTDFFRGTGSSRAVDFGQALSSLDFHCRGINTDKYTVLMHKRYRIQGNSNSTYVDRSGRNYMNMMMYKKIKRQLRFEQTADNSPISGRIFLVYWSDLFATADGTAPTTGAYAVGERHIAYFKEPSHCC